MFRSLKSSPFLSLCKLVSGSVSGHEAGSSSVRVTVRPMSRRLIGSASVRRLVGIVGRLVRRVVRTALLDS